MHKNFSERGFADYIYWQTQDKKTLNKINNLLKDIDSIDETNRLIFKIENDAIEISQCRTHYGDK